MPEETFTTLIPQRDESPEIISTKHAQAAARLLEGASYLPRIWETWSDDPETWKSVVPHSLPFRKAIVWGAAAGGTINSMPIRLRVAGNGNRLVNPGEMMVIEALPGQELDLHDFEMLGAYWNEVLTFELY